MRELFSLGHNQFEWARWAEKDPKQYKFIRVEIVREDEKRWSTVLQNVITRSDSTLLRTSYQFKFEPRQHIFYRNKWWEILNVGEITTEIAAQTLSLIGGGNKQYVLEVVQVDGYDA